jgi:hypothetical protein
MATGEDQPQLIVPELAVVAALQRREVRRFETGRRPGEDSAFLLESRLAPQAVEPLE